MTDHFWLNEEQLARIKPYFPLSHWVPRVDDRKVVNGIIHVIRNGLRWQDTPDVYGLHKTLCNMVNVGRRWAFLTIFCRVGYQKWPA